MNNSGREDKDMFVIYLGYKYFRQSRKVASERQGKVGRLCEQQNSCSM